MSDVDTQSAEPVVDYPTMAAQPALAWSVAETQPTPAQRRPMSHAWTGLLAAVMLSAIGLASYVLATGHAPPLPRPADPAPATTTPDRPLKTADRAPVTVTTTPPAVTVTAAPPVAPADKDQRYLNMVAADWKPYDWHIEDPALVIHNAHTVCAMLADPSHPTRSQVAHAINSPDNPPFGVISVLVADANAVYCPQLG
jgi:hypothetical protein